MFTDLLLALTMITGTAAVPHQLSVSTDRTIASPAPCAMAGPVRTRLRKPSDISQVASTADRQEIVYHRADDSVQPE